MRIKNITKAREASEIYSVRLFAVDCAEMDTGTAEASHSAWFTADAMEHAAVVYLESAEEALY
jgi:hypothetical protein